MPSHVVARGSICYYSGGPELLSREQMPPGAGPMPSWPHHVTCDEQHDRRRRALMGPVVLAEREAAAGGPVVMGAGAGEGHHRKAAPQHLPQHHPHIMCRSQICKYFSNAAIQHYLRVLLGYTKGRPGTLRATISPRTLRHPKIAKSRTHTGTSILCGCRPSDMYRPSIRTAMEKIRLWDTDNPPIIQIGLAGSGPTSEPEKRSAGCLLLLFAGQANRPHPELLEANTAVPK